MAGLNVLLDDGSLIEVPIEVEGASGPALDAFVADEIVQVELAVSLRAAPVVWSVPVATVREA